MLLVHGADDGETRSVHSERILAALAGPKALLLLPATGHNDAPGRGWREIEAWLNAAAPPHP